MAQVNTIDLIEIEIGNDDLNRVNGSTIYESWSNYFLNRVKSKSDLHEAAC